MAPEAPKTGDSPSRRQLLRRLAAGGAVSMAGLAGCDGDSGPTTPTDQGTPRFLLSTPQSGQYAVLGESERRGFELAVEHINNGGGLVDTPAFGNLGGTGVNGSQIEPLVVDTGGEPETARNNAGGLVGADRTKMFCGGVATRVVRTHRDLATSNDVPYFVGANVDPEFSAGNCAPQMFREAYPADAIVEAIHPVLTDPKTGWGKGGRFYRITSDTPEGRSLQAAMDRIQNLTDQPGTDDQWVPRGQTLVQRGTTNLTNEVQLAAAKRPDAIFLNMVGGDLANALAAAKDAVPDGTAVVAPFLDDRYGRIVDGGLSNVVATLPWDAGINNPRIDAFASAYAEANRGSRAGGIAHLLYTQTLAYANAAATAGSFDSQAVRNELSGGSYDVGLGSETMLSCRHQATRPVPVVRGRDEATAAGNHFEVTTLATGVVDGCDSDAAAACGISS